MELSCSLARIEDSELVSDVLVEASMWLEGIGVPLWRPEDFIPDLLLDKLKSNCFYLVRYGCEMAAVFSLERSDALFWPEIRESDSLFIHKLAVKRAYAKYGIPSFAVSFARSVAVEQRRKYLRLDCDALRPKLKALYLDLGFKYVDDHELAGYTASRFQMEVS